MSGGFWGLGLGLGLFLGVSSFRNPSFRLILGGALLGLSLAGVLGALAAGGGALARATLRALQDGERPLRTWAVTSVISALFFSLGLALVGYVSQAVGDSPRTGQTLLTGLLIGAVVAGTATLPTRLPWPVRLALTAAAGIAVFLLAGFLELLSVASNWWLALMGGAGGVGFFWALNPGFWREANTPEGAGRPDPIFVEETH
jgi:hypothetical protein